MSARPRVHINLELPELTPAQADSLWSFLENLASEIWNAYENEILEAQEEPSPYELLAETCCPYQDLVGDHNKADPDF